MNTQFQKILDRMPTGSAWARGVKATAFDMLESMEENGIAEPTKSDLLNGARGAVEVSDRSGGCFAAERMGWMCRLINVTGE